MKNLQPDYTKLEWWERYAIELETEYQQCLEEGLDVEPYKALFDAVIAMPDTPFKDKAADVIAELVLNLPQKEGYAYVEPSDLEGIFALCDAGLWAGGKVNKDTIEDQVHGAWLGRVCGCMLGKTVEGIRTNELIPFLKETGNYPMYRYILSTDLPEDVDKRYQFPFKGSCYADLVDSMPADDDTNYTALYQLVVDINGRDFTPTDVAKAWMYRQPKAAYCTAERVAFCNFVKGYFPPDSARYHNPYREWIGAQIRGDYFGYINPGDPRAAADMAFRDASVSHIKNGIYGEMWASAMIACAAVEKDMIRIIKGGLSQVPTTSRLYEDVMSVIDGYQNGVSKEECFAKIHEKYNEYTVHGWCHTISNAMIVAAALLYGGGDYGKSICMAVETGFDTDCNGATVGSVLGMRDGISAIGKEWSDPLCDQLDTEILGLNRARISDYAKKTMKHIKL